MRASISVVTASLLACSAGRDEASSEGHEAIASSNVYNFGAIIHPGSCLDVRAASSKNGAQIQEYRCNGTPAQSFRLADAGAGRYFIVNTSSNKCVDVQGGGTANGTNIQLWDCNQSAEQVFGMQDRGDGFVSFVNPNSHKCLDVTANKVADETPIQLYECNGTKAQKWNPSVIGAAPDAGSKPPPPPPPPNDAPTWSTEFDTEGGQWAPRKQPDGEIKFGAPDPQSKDNSVVALTLAGAPGLGPTDRAGPAYATEISTNRRFQFGTFRTRVQLAQCGSKEEAVNGIFTYFNDGRDENGNGITDNSEIDIEILCGTPSYISLTSWTDYGDDSHFIHWQRVIDTTTGNFSEVAAENSYDLVPKGNLPAFVHPSGFPDPSKYYEMGFDWREGEIRFFMVVDGQEITLWDLTAARYVPQLPSNFYINVWHPKIHWFGPRGSAVYPAENATMRVDWLRYWQ